MNVFQKLSMTHINQIKKKKLVMQTKTLLMLVDFKKKKTDNYAKTREIESKISSISGPS